MMVNDVDGYYFNRMLFHLIEVSKVSTLFLVNIHQVVYFLLVSTFSHSDITSIITSCVMMKHHFYHQFSSSKKSDLTDAIPLLKFFVVDVRSDFSCLNFLRIIYDMIHLYTILEMWRIWENHY